MTLLPNERVIVDGIFAEVTDDYTRTADQIDAAMAAVDDLAGSGVEWVQQFVRDLARRGMADEMADWRRRHKRNAKTAKGAEVETPEYGGIRRADEDGKREYHQLSLADLTPDEMEQWIADQQKSRDSLSRKIQWGKDVLAVAREMDAKTMGPAIAELERRHA